VNFSLPLALVNVLLLIEEPFCATIEETNTDPLKIENQKRTREVKCDTAIGISKRSCARH